MNDTIEILRVLMVLGLPVVGLSWFLLARLYDSGVLHEDADRDEIRASLKAMRKAAKKGERKDDFIQSRWMRFGGGFYGIVALWTFAVIEVTDAATFLWNFNSAAGLFDNGIMSFLIDALVNQITNFVSAMIWFTYWSSDEGSPITSFIVAYVAYLIGLAMARNGVRFQFATED